MATFGKTDIGGTAFYPNAEDIYAGRFTLTEAGDVSSITVHIYLSQAGNYKAAIYDVDGSNDPNALQGTSQENSTLGETWAWQTLTFSPDVSLTAADYYLAIWSTKWYGLKYDSGTEYNYRNVTYNGFPDPFGTPDGTASRDLSIYATYTATGGGLSIPVAMRTFRNFRTAITDLNPVKPRVLTA